ncbi:MAG: alpha/beta fold hydrolase [Nocardioidaceae bacterium]
MSAPAVPVSTEQYADLPRRAGTDTLRICYQTFGDPAHDAMLLVMGLGGPMTWWDPRFCRLLADRGFFVIRYDNRDTGRSTRVESPVNRRMIVRAFVGRRGTVRPPYTLGDMAEDGVGLLTALGIDRAHVVGVSMGGMIAQTMAIEHPERVRSLTSIMSTTGRRTAGWVDPRVLPLMLSTREATLDSYLASAARMWALIGSPAYPDPPDDMRARALETWDRGISEAGVARQMAAILAQPDRTPALHGFTEPALVIHGLNDKMVHVSGGRATARAIPGAELILVPGMGHDLPEPLFETFADAIARTASRAAG